MTLAKIQPFVHPLMQNLLASCDIFSLAAKQSGPIHLLIPEIMDENIERIKKIFTKHDVPLSLHFAQKSTQSQVFAKQALQAGVSLDVASENELKMALRLGFSASKISCTGPKSMSFLKLACQHRCLISIDSQQELERILTLEESPQRPTPILIRIAALQSSQRNLLPKPSRFGIPINHLAKILAMLQEKKDFFELKGFHFHHDGYDAGSRAELTESLITVVLQTQKMGFSPQILDLGGSFRLPLLENPQQWSEYVDHLCHQLSAGKKTEVWGSSPYGLTLTHTGRVEGREKLVAIASQESLEAYLTTFLNTTNQAGQKLAEKLQDSLLTVMLEPGFALIATAGATVFTIQEVKESPNSDTFVLVNGNMNHIGARMFEMIADPLHIPQTKQNSHESSGAYIVGNLCREDDFLLKRKVHFSQKPLPGDLLVFPNTAAYLSDFEESFAIQQSRGTKYHCQKENDQWSCTPELQTLENGTL